MRNILNALLGLLALLSISCEESENEPADVQWNKLGLDGKIVGELMISNNQLYAATYTGLYRKSIDGKEDFSLLGFSDQKVEAILVLEEVIFASVVDAENNGKFYKSTDDGDSWNEIENNFGGENSEIMHDLEVNPDDAQILYASGVMVVARSEDGGVTWEPIYGDWGGFGSGTDVVEINPNDVNEIWAGGQGAIENGFLLKFENDEWTGWNDLVENPTVVKEIVFDEENGEKVYVGFEGAFLATRNGGSAWDVLIDSEENRFFFGAGKSSVNSDLLFTAGWLKRFDDPQPLILYYSLDDGETWQEEKYNTEDFGGVYDMKIISEENQERLFLGLFKGGVYEVVIQRKYLDNQ